MKKPLAVAAVAAAVLTGSLFGTGVASATPNPAVCDGINESPTYLDYMVDANYMGRSIGYSTSQQAKNIVDSVRVYCPWHMSGINAAASYLANS